MLLQGLRLFVFLMPQALLDHTRASPIKSPHQSLSASACRYSWNRAYHRDTSFEADLELGSCHITTGKAGATGLFTALL